MELQNCSRCGRLFARVTKPICPECLRAEEEQYERVMEFLRANEGANLEEIADATGVPRDLVLRMVREDRIRVSRTEGSVVCRACGIQITSGIYCRACILRFGKEISGYTARVSHASQHPGEGASGDGGDSSRAILRMVTPERHGRLDE